MEGHAVTPDAPLRPAAARRRARRAAPEAAPSALAETLPDGWAGRLREALLKPAPHVTRAADRRRARFLAAVLLLGVPVGLVALGLVLSHRAAPPSAPEQIVHVVLFGALVVAYFLARTRAWQAGALVGVAVGLGASWVGVLASVDEPVRLVALLPHGVAAVLLASALFRPTLGIAVACVHLGVAVAVVWAQPAVPPSSAATLLTTLATLSGLAVLLGLLVAGDRREIDRAWGHVAEGQERYALAARGANDGIWDWDLRSDAVHFSPRWYEMVGLPTVQGRADRPATWLDLVHADDVERVRGDLDEHLSGRTPHFESTHRVIVGSGEVRWLTARGMVVREPDGTPARVAGSMTDITERKLFEEQLLHDALHDALTGLPNRALFLDRLAQTMARAQRHQGHLYAVLYLDLDDFKTINESLGHGRGDQLLEEVGKRLQHCIRPGDTVARLGGDEFAVLLDGLGSPHDAEVVADRVREALRAPFRLQTREIVTSASIGIAPSTGDYTHPQDLLRDADTAMFRAKAEGRGLHRFFHQHMHERAVARLDLENDLRRALERDELLVYYQPIVRLSDGRVTGFEALVRWRHPDRGIVGPTEFIPIAEETGLIHALGWMVLRTACHQTRRWQEMLGPERPLHINVNMSTRQFKEPGLRRGVHGILAESGLAPTSLRLEITESAMMDGARGPAEILTRFREDGIHVCIDDFGTGYSSLSYLHSFDIDVLKIDRSFVSRVGQPAKHPEIVRTIVDLSRNLGLTVTAEGVETREQLETLRGFGCDLAQGYYFSPPVDAREAERLLTSNPHW